MPPPMHPRDHTQLPSRKLRTWPLGVKRFLPMTAIDHVAKRTRTTPITVTVHSTSHQISDAKSAVSAPRQA